ncbi:uncharacterized protein CEXT_738491 [Caerostris extrusa]|uniref:Uncharacterized protein n=1 Tax=Caerostris extrusa TaxID=172846 RepID=A0AAV4XK57_CAEEX|nr:uncharacterized protein CEXT_738491 [Caerostris extrusa]
MKNAVKEEVLSTGKNEICVSGEETWKTGRHTFRIGVCSTIGDNTWKILDVEVLSSYFKGCEQWEGSKYGTAYDKWKLNHQPYYVKNHAGSLCKMKETKHLQNFIVLCRIMLKSLNV